MLNRIILMGRLVRDPELRTTQSGTTVTSFTLAVDRDFKSKDSGEKATDFIDVVAWRHTAEFVCKYFSKGRMAIAEGRLQIREWKDRDGNNRRTAEVVAENVYFGDSKKESDGGGYSQGSYVQSGYEQGGYPAQGAYPPRGGYSSEPVGYPESDYGGQFSEIADDDGDLPF